MKTIKRYYETEINKALAAIEDITKIMAHEDPKLKTDLQRFYDGDLKPIYFYARVMRYWDELQGVNI